MWVPGAIALRIIRQLTNDRRTIGMIFFVPILMTLVLGYAFQGETYDNPIVVVNQDPNILGEKIVDHLRNDTRVRIISETTSFEEAKLAVHNRSAKAAIFLPENLSLALPLNITVSILVFYDEAEPAIGGSIFKALSDSL